MPENGLAPHVLVAVLAAGRASRFGGGKLDASCAGKPVGQWALDAVAAAGLQPGVIVVGASVPEFARMAGAWELVVNADADWGIGSSLACAARAAIDRSAWLLVLLADMPLIEAVFLRRFIVEGPPAATHYPNGRPGVPALFGRSMLPELAVLSGTRGAAPLLADVPRLTLLQPGKNMLLDIDRREDLEAAAEILRQRQI